MTPRQCPGVADVAGAPDPVTAHAPQPCNLGSSLVSRSSECSRMAAWG
jgi:hypothetical protein